MSGNDEKALQNSKVDEDLSELLDSSLQDFGKSLPLSSSRASAAENGNDTIDAATVDGDFDPKSAQQAAADFQNMLKQIAEVQKIMLQNMSTTAGDSPASAVPNPPADPADLFAGLGGGGGGQNPFGGEGMSESEEMQFAQAFLQNMQFLAEKAQKVQEAKDENEFSEAMKDLSNDESYEGEFLPFMQGLMGSLLSKDMLYPSLKEMCDKYPVWLEENKSKLDSQTLERYETQLRLMTEACREYEDEKEGDTDEVKGQRFERLVITMQKVKKDKKSFVSHGEQCHFVIQMQACGHPPEELVGSLPPGWSLDNDTGVPRVVDTEKAAESCSIM